MPVRFRAKIAANGRWPFRGGTLRSGWDGGISPSGELLAQKGLLRCGTVGYSPLWQACDRKARGASSGGYPSLKKDGDATGLTGRPSVVIITNNNWSHYCNECYKRVSIGCRSRSASRDSGWKNVGGWRGGSDGAKSAATRARSEWQKSMMRSQR